MKLYKIFGALGTGKTEYLTNAFLEAVKQYSSNEVLFATYTKGGEKAIKERLKQKGYDPDNFSYIGTMHKICSRLLGYSREQGMNNQEKRRFILGYSYVYKEEKEENEDFLNPEKFLLVNKPFANACFAIISRCRSRCIPIERWQETLDEDEDVPFTQDQLLLFYKRYTEYKIKNGKLDYDDVIEKVHEMRMFQKGIKVMFFDEFQDFWEGLFQVYLIWKANCQEIVYIAGDPNQTIYGFMGADSKHFLNEIGEEIILKVNWRCKKDIWEMAKKVIGKASFYDVSKIIAKEDGGTIIRSSGDILEFIKKNDEKRTQTLVLTRTVKQTNEIYMKAMEMGIPIQYSAIQGKISDKFINISNFLIKLSSKDRSLKIWTSIEVYDFITSTKVGRAMLQPKVQARFKKGLYKKEDWNYIEVRELFHYFYEPDPILLAKLVFEEYQLDFFLKHLSKDSVILNPVIQIGTMHSSKGRTVDSVIILNEMPYIVQKKWYNKGLEYGERRLLHVACGRARKELIIVDTWKSYPFL